ncbi:MAG: tungstate ABC transporter [Chloroflexi bacterium]|jgi:tungstate transport system substrate-binding protein|nr:tungstate ABC transporter [Chloroflexota bacterium]MBT4001819.1 tungstate ABC transporter [Chloroflexota bacterium]MBT4304614.1 tungstate ABC transporter [Chloroflexota bacterium]MBT4534045.1 tungstate ABC transporter [Chloroflexota bacterium]MBT4683263.1 tungstate ABC transporter [Chloroflexota bacterium]
MNKKVFMTLILCFVLITAGCSSGLFEDEVLRIATTTSLDNSGLLALLVPDFEYEYEVEVEIIAVGTGQALALGENGDVDLVLVHAPELEIAFVDSGYGTERHVIMYNDFIILGPESDPANISNLPLSADAITKISESNSIFVSRGDNSGTHFKENQIWADAGLDPDQNGEWYNSVGQGMGASLVIANEKEGYILSDRGTYLSQKENLPNLVVLFGGDSSDKNPDLLLQNIYSVIPINPEKFENVNADLSDLFVEWISSIEIQNQIGEFGVSEFGIPLFYSNSTEWISSNSLYIEPQDNLKQENNSG